MCLNIKPWCRKCSSVFLPALPRPGRADRDPSGSLVKVINISLAELALGLQSLTRENSVCSWAFHHCDVTYIIIQYGLANIKSSYVHKYWDISLRNGAWEIAQCHPASGPSRRNGYTWVGLRKLWFKKAPPAWNQESWLHGFQGIDIGIEIPAGTGPRGQRALWFILHRASLSKSHRKGSIIMKSLCARTGQFGKLS